MSYASITGAARLPAWICVFLFAVGVSAPAHAANQRPTISGTPSSWVYIGSQYSFKANGYDAEGATLRYTIQNKPSWASFATDDRRAERYADARRGCGTTSRSPSATARAPARR